MIRAAEIAFYIFLGGLTALGVAYRYDGFRYVETGNQEKTITVSDVVAMKEALAPVVHAISESSPVPRLYLRSFPPDWARQEMTRENKQYFFAALLPLVLAENERILRLRSRLFRIDPNSRSGRAVLQELARAYRLKPERKDLLGALAARMNVLPPSLVLAQAAQESGWGRSRFAILGNALFGEWTWNAAEGIMPARRDSNARHFVRRFPDLRASLASYMRNLNSHRAYVRLRQLRNEMLGLGMPLRGERLAETLVSYSQEGEDYVRKLRRMIRSNDLERFDRARLQPLRRKRVLVLAQVLAGFSARPK